MGTKVAVPGLLLLCTVFALFWGTGQSAPTVAASDEGATMKASPAEGYTVHVLAPHLVEGKQMGPYHHYCKVLAPDAEVIDVATYPLVGLRREMMFRKT